MVWQLNVVSKFALKFLLAVLKFCAWLQRNVAGTAGDSDTPRSFVTDEVMDDAAREGRGLLCILIKPPQRRQPSQYLQCYCHDKFKY